MRLGCLWFRSLIQQTQHHAIAPVPVGGSRNATMFIHAATRLSSAEISESQPNLHTVFISVHGLVNTICEVFALGQQTFGSCRDPIVNIIAYYHFQNWNIFPNLRPSSTTQLAPRFPSIKRSGNRRSLYSISDCVWFRSLHSSENIMSNHSRNTCPQALAICVRHSRFEGSSGRSWKLLEGPWGVTICTVIHSINQSIN